MEVLKNLTGKAYQIGRCSTNAIKSVNVVSVNQSDTPSSSSFRIFGRNLASMTESESRQALGLSDPVQQQRYDMIGKGKASLNLINFNKVHHQAYASFEEGLIEQVKIEEEDMHIGVGEALYLTQYIRNGRIKEAQELAAVTTLTSGIQSYAGYLTVNEQYNSNIFFWFFPSKYNAEEAPVLLWLNGGPGASSMFGLFAGNGPILVDRNQQLKHRKTPWTLNHSVLYIDSPVGTGFSFTEDESGFARTLDDVTMNLYEALQQFFILFSNFRSRDFYITGQSYTGKYAPAISFKIHEGNKLLPVESRIKLRGMAIGSGMCDPATQADYGNFLYNIGLIGEQEKEYFDGEHRRLLKCIENKDWTEAHKVLQDLIVGWPRPIVSHFETVTGYSFNSNYLQEDMPEEYGNYIKFLQSDHVRQSIHVGNHLFGKMRDKVYCYLSDDFAQSVKPLVEELLDANYKVLFYASQLDVIVPHTGINKFIRSLKWKHSADYLKQARSVWRVQNEIAGYHSGSHNLVHLLLRNAGHSAPLEQPERCLDMITRFTRDLPF